MNTHTESILDDEALDLVSARFADLVAQEYQQRLIDQISRHLFQCDSEEELAKQLLRAIGQRCGEHRLLYIGIDEPGHPPRLFWSGYAQPPVLTRSPARSLLNTGNGPILEEATLKLALGHDLPCKAGLRLSGGRGPLALVVFDRAPEERILRDFLERLAERASPALLSLRQREGLEQARRAMHRQRLQMEKQAKLLHLMEDWNGVLNRLEGRYEQLDELLKTAVATLGGEKGSLMLLDENNNDLVVKAVCGLEGEVQEKIRRGEQPCKRLKLGEGVAGKVAQSLEPMIVNQVEQEPLFLEPHLSQVSSIVCLPLHVDGLVLGVMNITNRLSGRSFQPQQLEEGMRLAQQASQAINNSRLYHLAVLDPITEVYTRSHLYQRLHDEVARARRYQRHVCLLAINLQGLEVVRNHHGHPLGNQLEIHFAELLQKALRETDMVARLGEHTFAAMLPETNALAGMFAAERVCQEARESELLTRYYVTAHIGLASFPDLADSVPRLVARAEMAMASAVRSNDPLPVLMSTAV